MEKGNGDFVSVCPTLCGRLADFFYFLVGGPYVSGCLGVKGVSIESFSFRQTKREVGKKGARKWKRSLFLIQEANWFLSSTETKKGGFSSLAKE